MSDDSNPQDPPEDDDRDTRIAALLEVPPLDDVTRRRLVRTAVAAASGPRSRLGLAIPVAAALVIGAVIGTVVVTRPDDSTTTAARPEVSTSLEAPAQRAGEPETFDDESPAVAPSEAAPPADLGDLGSVSSIDELRDAVRDARGRTDLTDETAAVPLCAAQLPDVLNLVVVAAVGSGVVGAAPATVLVGTEPSGREVAIVLRASDCVEVLRADLTA